MAAISPWVWAVAAVVIAFLELPVPGSYLIWIAAAAALTAVFSFALDFSLNGQLTLFAASCIGTCVAGYFVYRHLSLRGQRAEALNRRDLDLVGRSGVASEAFVNGRGHVRINDSLWLAESEDEIAAGARVSITAVQGTSLVVRRA